MVDFIDGIETEPSGPCRRIMRRMGDLIRDMVADTERSGKEHAVVIVEGSDEMAATEVKSGTENSITSDITASLRMEAMSVHQEISTVHSRNVKDYDTHFIHTHPEGHPEPSFRDIETIAEDVPPDGIQGNSHTSHLIATMTDRGVYLGGIYRTKLIDDDARASINATLSAMQSDEIAGPMTIQQKKRNVLQELQNQGYKGCAVLFPQQ